MKNKNLFSAIGKAFLIVVILASAFTISNAQDEKYIGLQLYSLRADIKKDLVGTIEAVRSHRVANVGRGSRLVHP